MNGVRKIPPAARIAAIGLVVTALATALFAFADAHAGQDDAGTVFHSDVGLVEAYVSVLDSRGNPLPHLTPDRFQVFDAGRQQEIIAFEGVDDKVSCALLLDVTESMEAFLPVLKNSLVRFVDELRAEEEVGVYTFNSSLQLAQPFTTDKKLIKQAVMRIRARGGTALFDAVANVSHDLVTHKGKKALVLFTDGADNASMLTALGASTRARLSGVPMYVIAEGDALRDKDLLETLTQLATTSGGLVFRLDDGTKIDDVFASIVKVIRNTYLLAWKLPDSPRDAWRPLRFAVPGIKGARIQAKQGYIPK